MRVLFLYNTHGAKIISYIIWGCQARNCKFFVVLRYGHTKIFTMLAHNPAILPVQSRLATNKESQVRINRVEVYDMDGTIVDSMHRYRTIRNSDGSERIDLEYWRANEFRAMDDSLLPLAAQYQRDLRDPHCYVIIATARVINQPDARFINNVLGCPDYIVSRKHNDSQSGKTLKCNGLAKFFNLKNFALADWTFYEDNRDYLNAVCTRFPIKPVYVQSNQGH